MFHCFIFETAIYYRKDLNLFVLPWPRTLYFANIIKRGKFKVMLGKKKFDARIFIIIPLYDPPTLSQPLKYLEILEFAAKKKNSTLEFS